MEMYNADGSQGAMCGNGIRCVAKYVYDYGLTDKTSISVDTKSGVKYLELTVKDGKVKEVRVNMGSPILDTEKIPMIYSKSPVISQPLNVNQEIYEVTAVSMGNPHAVVYMDDVKNLKIKDMSLGWRDRMLLGCLYGGFYLGVNLVVNGKSMIRL